MFPISPAVADKSERGVPDPLTLSLAVADNSEGGVLDLLAICPAVAYKSGTGVLDPLAISPAIADKSERGVLDPLALSPAVTDKSEKGVLDPLAITKDHRQVRTIRVNRICTCPAVVRFKSSTNRVNHCNQIRGISCGREAYWSLIVTMCHM